MHSDKIEKKIANIIIREPHLSRAEAIALLQSKGKENYTKRREVKRNARKKKLREKGKSTCLKKSVYTVSGGKVSPR